MVATQILPGHVAQLASVPAETHYSTVPLASLHLVLVLLLAFPAYILFFVYFMLYSSLFPLVSHHVVLVIHVYGYFCLIFLFSSVLLFLFHLSIHGTCLLSGHQSLLIVNQTL